MSDIAIAADFEDRVLRSEPMSRHTSWHVGGPADVWFNHHSPVAGRKYATSVLPSPS